MKALSLKQPWAELILLGKKTIEIRKWGTKFRGEFLIHTSKVPNQETMDALGFKNLPLGCIVGKARIVDVKTYTSLDDFKQDADKHRALDYDWPGKLYGFILEDVGRVPQQPLQGKLGFFDID